MFPRVLTRKPTQGVVALFYLLGIQRLQAYVKCPAKFSGEMCIYTSTRIYTLKITIGNMGLDLILYKHSKTGVWYMFCSQ